MDIIEQDTYIKKQYELLSDNNKANYQILYNIILAKVHFQKNNLWQSLYLDAKQFVSGYIEAADTEDYGYDIIKLSKIINVAEYLPLKQRLSLMNTVRRLFVKRGYDTAELSQYISQLEIKLSFQERRLFNGVRLWLGFSFGRLVLAYCLYVTIVGIVLLPAPIPVMEVFMVSMVDYYDGPVLNHIANTLALMCGKDGVGPDVKPIGIMGVSVYSLGLLFFYFVFGNFIFKKMEDFVNSK